MRAVYLQDEDFHLSDLVLGETVSGPFALIIKKYFNEHKAYFNLNCREVYRFESRVW